jgi:hypothetical protein
LLNNGVPALKVKRIECKFTVNGYELHQVKTIGLIFESPNSFNVKIVTKTEGLPAYKDLQVEEMWDFVADCS